MRHQRPRAWRGAREEQRIVGNRSAGVATFALDGLVDRVDVHRLRRGATSTVRRVLALVRNQACAAL